MRTILMLRNVGLIATFVLGALLTPSAAQATAPFRLAPGVNQFTVGANSACAIDENHHLYCWGDNSGGTLGLKESVTFSSTPRRVGTAKWRSVFGDITVCGIKWNYSVWCWGHAGMIGLTANDRYNSARFTPQLITARPTVSVERIHPNVGMCIRDRKLQLWCRVDPDAFFVSGWKLISATPTQEAVYNDSEICFLTLSKIMKCWGKNPSGSFPTGAGTPTFVKKPRAVSGAYETLLGTPLNRLRCALDTQGIQRCWGNSQFRHSLPDRVPDDWFTANGLPCSGELCVMTPTKIEDLVWGTLWADQCGLLATGEVSCIHNIKYVATNNNVVVATIDQLFTRIMLSKSVGCGAKADRTLWCWGLQDFASDSVSGPRTFGKDVLDYSDVPTQVVIQ